MAKIISASIDLNKIDKAKIVNKENGSKYYNFSIFINNEKDNYGNDVAIAESQTKEQREAKEKKKYIGNGKIVWNSDANSHNSQTKEVKHKPSSDDLPF